MFLSNTKLFMQSHNDQQVAAALTELVAFFSFPMPHNQDPNM
jgi:hypothetical protein